MGTRALTTPRPPSAAPAPPVIRVPPPARDAQGKVSRAENQKIVRHIEAGGVDILLYGGNANFYHLPPSESRETLAILAEIAAEGTLVVPSVGTAYGLSLDQAEIARDFA